MINDFFRRFDADTKRSGGTSASSADHHHQQHPHGGIRGHLEKQTDGSLLYKVAFDVHGYGPEDLKTSLVGDRTVQVSGRSSLADSHAGKRTSVSFDEQFALPDNVDASQLRSVVSNGQLVLSAPVLPPPSPQPHSTKLQLAATSRSAPAAHNQHQQQPPTLQLPQYQHQNQQQHQQQLQHSTVKKQSVYQLEIDLGRGEFSAADVRVSTADAGSRLVVHGQRQARTTGKTSFREFRDEFDLPGGLDLARMAARLRSDGRVFVEAPFRPEPEPGFEYQSLAVVHH